MNQPARVELADPEILRTLCGGQSENLKLIGKKLGVSVGQRGSCLLVSGATEAVAFADRLLRELYELLQRGYRLYPEDIDQAIKTLSLDERVSLRDIFMDSVFVSNRKRAIAPKGLAQKRYVEAIRRHDIVFGIGPAGTGKTYLAMAMAAAALVEHRVKRLILTRPAVEAGEKLGFLPGDLAEKINPYLRPLYDALHDMMDAEKVASLMERGTIEVAPLAFMRGRTLNDAFVILDEAQNTTPEQMKMFLTRLGFGSRAVVTGDITQIDLPTGQPSGLIAVREILQDVEGLRFCQFSEVDVVRHPLVQEIVQAYERWDLRRKTPPSKPPSKAVMADEPNPS
ncbi:MAG: PhoH family protein [Myxococcales bacterium]|jgi:phosphate starvation-inducible PhoH-like protein|nr:PhoH family protein [Myxococcales bacterium]